MPVSPRVPRSPVAPHVCTRVADLSPADEATLLHEVTGVYGALMDAIDAYCVAHPATRVLACLMAAQSVCRVIDQEEKRNVE